MRRMVLPVILLVTALCAAFMANSSDEDSKPAVLDTTVAEPSPVTPVLSARRVPDLVAIPAAEADLAESLSTFMDTIPGDSCLSVSHDGRVVLEIDVDAPLVPASTQKLVTAQAVLELLGPDATFETTVYAAGPISDGTINGDLWLLGGGDPVLATDDYLASYKVPPVDTDLEALADLLVADGLNTVEGGVHADETRYDTERYVAVWPERFIDQNQTGPLSAMTVNDGFSQFSSDNFQSSEAVPASDPALSAAAEFDDLLEARGVTIFGGQVSEPLPADVIELGSVKSPPLTDIVTDMINKSDNATAELLVKELGYTAGDGPEPVGSTAAGVDEITSVVAESGLDSDGVVVTDGSGLSPDNRLTCTYLIALLVQEGVNSPVTAGLAVAGESGTLRDRFIGTDVEGRLRAKTGTLNDVTALAGFLDTVRGDRFTFSFLVNAPDLALDALAYQNTLVETLAAYPSGVPIAELGPM
ncbi:MAG: D-alanyl-D-alanine carboxypeptidase/D-alanyl-D-alanine-endopeptidase [Acidobacteria bacterium]|nr:D-alanyl-D-alanine carboxypeptidase/D-alanyl-D-alanine-endopeptidase [Acidobacteriota bacterium]